MVLEGHHETHCGHGVSYDDECQQCEDIWIEDTVTWLRRRARRLGYRLTPMYRESGPLKFGMVEKRGAHAIGVILDGLDHDDVAGIIKTIVDNVSEIRAFMRWAELQLPA